MACKLSDLAERTEQTFVDDKRAVSQDEFVLERVQGLTSTGLHSLASNPVTGWVAFPAACVLVLLDPKTNEQKFIESPSLRNISCCAFTDDGRFVAFGETGMKPHIAMWNLREHKECHKFVTDVTVRAIFIHPTSPILISLGLKENLIVVWDYVKGMRMASCKWQTMPLSLTIPRVGFSLVVCGHRKITLFNISKVDSKFHETNVFEDRRTVLLGKQSEYTFVDIESGRGKHERTVYTVTSCGYLCEVKLGDILIDKAIKVDTQTFCVKYSTELLFVGCPAGLVKICDPDNLTVTAAVSLSNLLGPSAIPKVGNKGFIDVCTLVVDENEKIVTCVYADCSMHSWQIGTDGQKIVCSAIEPGAGANGNNGHPVSKSNLLRAFIGCCEKTKTGLEFLNKFSMTEHSKPPMQYGGRRLVNENRASYQNVNAVRFTPDGKDVICGNEEGEIKVYELSTGILRRVIEAHSSQVTCIELMYDDDFQLVCSGGRDRVMFVLNARNDFSLVQVLCDHSAAITAISLVNHKGVLTLVSAAADNVILIRRAILGGTLRFTITGEIAQTNCSRSFFVTSDYIALGGKDSQIKVFKADPVFISKPLKTINCQKLCPSNAGFRAIDIDPSSSFMAVSQANGNISVYHLQTGQPVASLPLQSDINNIQFTDDLKYMISSTANGCDLVWRLPERMTDFMRSKQEKTYQIETNKEVTYETYMSCVKVCKEEEDDAESLINEKQNLQENKHSPRGIKRQDGDALHHSHLIQNSSNHNSEWEQTPSIDSISILDQYNRHAFGMGKCTTKSSVQSEDDVNRSRGCSTCGCESVLSCSTCTHSVSTTTHTSCCSAVESDSSVATVDGQGRQAGSKHLRFYCGADHKLFGQVIDETRCIKVGHFRENAQTERIQWPNKTFNKTMSSIEETLMESKQGRLSTESIRQSTLTAKMETLAIHSSRGDDTDISIKNDDISEEETPKASLIQETKETSEGSSSDAEKNLDTADDISMDEKECLNKDEKNADDNTSTSDPSAQNKFRNSERSSLTSHSSVEPRFIRSKKIQEKASFYENVMKGDLKSTCRASTSSPTRQHTASVKDAVRSFTNRPRHQKENNQPLAGGDILTLAKDAVEKLSPNHWTPLTTPEYSNTSSDITNLVPSSSSTLADLYCCSKQLQDSERPPLVDDSLDMLARDCKGTLLSLKCSEKTSNVAPWSDGKLLIDDTRAQSAETCQDDESFQTAFGENVSVDPSEHSEEHTFKNKPMNNEESNNCDNSAKSIDILPTSERIAEFQPLQPSVDKTMNCVSSLDADPNDGITNKFLSKEETKENARLVLDQILLEQRQKQELKDCEHPQERQSVIEELESDGFMLPEKYHSALRSCMQLSNSQETFATLRVDTNDMELMTFLSHALKKKLVAAGLIGLSHDEIDNLLKSEVNPSRMSTIEKKQLHSEPMPIPSDKSTPDNAIQDNTILKDEDNRIGETEPKLELTPAVEIQQDKTDEEKQFGEIDGEKVCSTETQLDEFDINSIPHDEIVTSQKSNDKECKKGVYKTILNKLSSARKRMVNKSANRSATTESELSLDDNTLDETWLEHDQQDFQELLNSDTYVRLQSSDESQLFVMKDPISKCDNISAEREGELEDKAKLDHSTIAGEKKQRGHSCERRGAFTFNKAPRSQSSNRDSSQLEQLTDCTNSSTEFPSCNSESNSFAAWLNNERKNSANVSPTRHTWKDKCYPEKLGLNKPQGASITHSTKSNYTHSTLDVKVCPGAASIQTNEEGTNSRADSRATNASRADPPSSSDSGVEASYSTKSDKPLSEIFRDQDEYLRKLKEVRENFERSIQALSEERKSRREAEEKASGLSRP